MFEHSARPVRHLAARVVYDLVCGFAMVAGVTTGLLLYLEFGQLTVPSRIVLAVPPVLVGVGLANRRRRRGVRS